MSASLILQTLGWVPVVWLVTAHLLVERGHGSRDGANLRIAGCAAAVVVVAAAIVANMWPVAALGLLWLRTEVFAHRHPIHEFQAHREQVRQERAERDQARHELAEQEHDQPVLVPRDVPGGIPHDQPIPSAEDDEAHQAAAGRPADRHPAQVSPGVHLPPDHPAPTGPAPSLPAQTLIRTDDPAGGGSATLPRPRRNPRPTTGRGSVEPDPTRPGGAHPGGTHPGRRGSGSRALDAIFKIEVMVVVIVVLVAIGAFAQHQRHDFNHKANKSLCRLLGGC